MFQLKSDTTSPINVDCIKVCPFDEQYFAFAYYQQNPNFTGGIAVRSITEP